jgi:hypothetical protein
MSLASFFSKLKARSEMKQPRGHFRRQPRKLLPLIRPSLEQLEDRTLLSTISWINPAGGDWDTASNWMDDQGVNRLPDSSDNAVINQPGSITITHGQGIDSINSLQSNQSLVVSGGTLAVTTTLQDTSTFLLAGGTLQRATITSDTTLTGTGSSGTLDGVTMNGNLDLATNNNAQLGVVDGLTINSTVTLGQADGSTAGQMFFLNTETLAAQGASCWAAPATTSWILRFTMAP